MKVKLSVLLWVLALASTPAFAQSGVSGKWVGELSAADGHGIAQPITMELKVDGENLSGTVTEGALESRPLMAASIEGNSVTFRTVRNLGGSDINVNWKGQLKGEELTFTREIGPAPAEAGGRGGGRGGGGGAAGGGRGGRGGAAPAAGGQRGAAAPATPAAPAAAAPIPPVPNAQNAQTGDTPDAPAAAGGRGGRGGAAPAAGGQRGGRGGAPAAGAAAGQAAGGGGRGAAAPAPGPTVTLTLRRAR
jgi:hypothetical protein